MIATRMNSPPRSPTSLTGSRLHYIIFNECVLISPEPTWLRGSRAAPQYPSRTQEQSPRACAVYLPKWLSPPAPPSNRESECLSYFPPYCRNSGGHQIEALERAE